MALYFRKRVKLTPNTWVNLSKSGVSLSARRGRVTANTRGNIWIRLLSGLYFRKHL